MPIPSNILQIVYIFPGLLMLCLEVVIVVLAVVCCLSRQQGVDMARSVGTGLPLRQGHWPLSFTHKLLVKQPYDDVRQ